MPDDMNDEEMMTGLRRSFLAEHPGPAKVALARAWDMAAELFPDVGVAQMGTFVDDILDAVAVQKAVLSGTDPF